MTTSSGQKRPRILAVDDTPSNLRMLKSMLASEPRDIIEAHDGVEALELAPEVPPDLITTDLIMPRMDGINLTKA